MTTSSTARPTTRRARILAVLAVAALLVAGCSGSRGGGAADSALSGDDRSASWAYDDGAAEAGSDAVAPADSALGTAAAAAAAAAQAGAREVVTTGTATLVADDPLDAVARVTALAEQAGGRVERRVETRGTDTDPAGAHVTLRLPADQVNATIDALRGLGDVVDVSLQKEDVTATGRDLDARVAALETSTARLVELLSQAASTADLLDVERELAARQADLDALKAQRADLSDRVAMSTLDVDVVADEAAAARLAPAPTGFRGGLAAGWHALAGFGRGATVAVGAALPWLLLAGAGYAAWRGVAGGVRRVRARDVGQRPRDAVDEA
ncbi:DUF4349 domain-containing protein [Xylanimonas protaetiae]|uniref:DUF4349 domain-containing protein n=1 Tax=Xylanimonas protaetiae TaxID=2509457 RepID=A0A4P6F6J0_9MICO|nr:DUF4349 domain-containing protein [Xylanimonas protaetiae]QAY70403.1 DUF4349 domain-containing protein [Xylanimonas protaetiae]